MSCIIELMSYLLLPLVLVLAVIYGLCYAIYWYKENKDKM